MKKQFFTLTICLLSFAAFAQYTQIPDSNFENALSAYDDIPNDGQVPTANINTITTLDVSNQNITDLTGIQDFVMLNKLNCYDNQLTSLFLTANTVLTELDCHNNQISILNLNTNISLTKLWCYGNQLTSLDVSLNIVLNTFFCNNNQISSLDLSNNTSLIYVFCENNQLSSFNVKNGNNTNIIAFKTINNPNLSCIEVDDVAWSTTNWTAIDAFSSYSTDCHYGETYVPDDNFEYYLEIHGMGNGVYNDNYVTTANINSITDLDVSDENITDLTGIEGFIALTELDCSQNQLTTLNITQLINLLELDCSDNQIASLDVTQNSSLINLSCSENQISSLDVTQISSLINLSCYGNQLTSIDVTQNLNLLYLACAFNQLTTLDVTQNNNLIGLMCGNSQLANFNLTQNDNLEVLYCYTSPLVTALDLSFNINLTDLKIKYGGLGISNLNLSQNTSLENIQIEDCSNLTSLDLSSNSNLQYVTCSNNNSLGALNIKNGNNTNIFYSSNTDNLGYQFYATNNPNLTCIEVDDAVWSTANWTNIDAQANFSENCHFDETYVPDDNFENYLEIHDSNGVIVTLGDSTSMGNGIANDDYVFTSSVSSVINLDVHYLGIADLTGIEDFLALTVLECGSNQLTNLDVTQNANLSHLDCWNNQLLSLNISQNTSLLYLSCIGNQLTSIDVTNNTLLTKLQLGSNQLSNLNVSQNIALNEFGCPDNLLTNLDISQNINLAKLLCFSNQLTSLDVSQNTSLNTLQCESNQITSLDLTTNNLLSSMRCYNNQLTSLDIRNGNNTALWSYNFDSTNNPNLTCILVDDAAWSTANWTYIDAASTFVNNQAECSTLSVDSYQNDVFSIYPNPTKNQVIIKTNSVSSYKIFTINGQLILEGKLKEGENKLNIENLINGVYFVNINSGNSHIIKKLIVQK